MQASSLECIQTQGLLIIDSILGIHRSTAIAVVLSHAIQECLLEALLTLIFVRILPKDSMCMSTT